MSMINQEKITTVSLRSLGSLIRVTGRKAKIEESQIDNILAELKGGDFQKITEFEKLVDDLLNNILENIKLFAQRDENKKIEMISNFLSDFFNYHIFDSLDNEVVSSIKSAFNKDLDKLIKDLRQEKRDERKIRHGTKPIHTIFKRLFRSNKSLDRQVMRDGKREIQLETEEVEIRKNLKQLIILLTKEKKSLAKTQISEVKFKIKDLLLKFAKIVFQEFEAIHEAEVDVETQEVDLINEIKNILKLTKKNKQVQDQLQKIIQNIESHLKNDFYVAKRMLIRAKVLKQDINGKFVQAKEEKKGIPLITEFPSGMVVMVVNNKDIVILNPDYLLGKHGTGTESVGSKFNQLKTSKQIYMILVKKLSKVNLKDPRVVLNDIDTGMNVGTDSLMGIKETYKWGISSVEEIRGAQMNIVKTNKSIPPTSLMNIVLIPFNPQFGMNVDKDFSIKYGKSFNEFESVHVVITMFPGKYAPSANPPANKNVDPVVGVTGEEFWSKHALLKKR